MAQICVVDTGHWILMHLSRQNEGRQSEKNLSVTTPYLTLITDRCCQMRESGRTDLCLG